MILQITSDRGLLSSLKWDKSRFLTEVSTNIVSHFCLIRMKLLNLCLSLIISGFFISSISVFAVEPKKSELPAGLESLPSVDSPWNKHESKSIPMATPAHSLHKIRNKFTIKSPERLRREVQESKSFQDHDPKIAEFRAGAFLSAASERTQKTFTNLVDSEPNMTPSSKSFISVGIHPVLGQGWIDPASVVWYDLAIDPQTQKPLELTQIEAHRFCFQHRMRLPKVEDFKKLRFYLHISSDFYEVEEFPHFKGYRFWTSSILNQEPISQGIAFNGDREKFFPSSQESKYQVRCILGVH